MKGSNLRLLVTKDLESMEGEYVSTLVGKNHRSMDSIVAHPLLQSASSVFDFSQRRLKNFPEGLWGYNANSAKIREGEMTLIARNQIVDASFHSATENVVIRGVCKNLKVLARIDDGGMSADSSDYVPEWRGLEPGW